MIIKDERQATLRLVYVGRFFRKYANHSALLGFIVISLGICIPNLYILSDLKSEQQEQDIQLKKSALNKLIQSDDSFGPIYLDIKQKSLHKLEYARKEALKKAYLTEEEKSVEVKGLLREKTLELPVSLRFKGDLVDHLEGDQWSFRVKVKDGKFFRGMKEFSIQHPKVRNYLAEYLFNLANKQEGVLAHRYDFVIIERNNKTPKLYALEEHFTKQLIENSGRREGPILKFDESLWWKVRHNWKNVGSYKNPAGAGDYFSLDVDAFSMTKIKNDPVKYNQYRDAYSLLESFRDGKKKASEVFVSEKMAKFLALSDLFGAYHGLALNQARFYFNPILAKLEPIPFDANPGDKLQAPIGAEDRTIFNLINIRQLFEDENFMKEYISALDQVSKVGWLENFHKSNSSEIKKREVLLLGFFPHLDLPWKQISENAKRIREFLEPLQAVKAHKQISHDGRTSLLLANLHSLPIEILSIQLGDSVYKLKSPLILEPRLPNSRLDYREVTLDQNYSKLLTENSLATIRSRVLGMGLEKEKTISLEDLWVDKLSNPMRHSGNHKDFAFIKSDPNSSLLTIPAGTSVLISTLVIPEGFKLKIQAGANILFNDRAHLVSYSPIEAIGTKDKPITFTGVASSAKLQGGVVIANTKKQDSKFDYVSFEKLGAPAISDQGWELTGSVNFYESNVIFTNSVFKSNVSGDDILNIIRSEFKISDSIFASSLADALDVDFGKGSIGNCEFVNTGNDGIDISGTTLSANNINFNQIGDKGISVGERSSLKASQLDISKAHIVIAAKDGSTAEIDQINIKHAEIGFVSLQKKPEYGPAKIEVTKAEGLDNLASVHQIEKGSLLILESTQIDGTHESLRAELY